MLEQYGEIDIALDPFPFNGGMTTLEALWMGVPVVTIAGNSVVSRQTVSALANIGLADELAFPNVKACIQGAVALANNRAGWLNCASKSARSWLPARFVRPNSSPATWEHFTGACGRPGAGERNSAAILLNRHSK